MKYQYMLAVAQIFGLNVKCVFRGISGDVLAEMEFTIHDYVFTSV